MCGCAKVSQLIRMTFGSRSSAAPESKAAASRKFNANFNEDVNDQIKVRFNVEAQ